MYCGVWTATRYWTPFFGSSQKLGDTWPLELSDTSASFGDVPLREPLLARLGAIDVQAELGLVHDLGEVHVDGPAHARDLIRAASWAMA